VYVCCVQALEELQLFCWEAYWLSKRSVYLRTCQQSENDIVSVSTDMDGPAGQSKLVSAYDASACGCSGEQ